MITDAIVMFFYDVGNQPILQLSDCNTSFPKVCLLFTILLISILRNCLCRNTKDPSLPPSPENQVSMLKNVTPISFHKDSKK